MSVIQSTVCRMYKYSHAISPNYLPAQQSHIGSSTASNRFDLTPLATTYQHTSNPINQTMSSINPQPLRKTTATLYLTTFILTLTNLSTAAAVRKPPPLIVPLLNQSNNLPLILLPTPRPTTSQPDTHPTPIPSRPAPSPQPTPFPCSS